MLELLGFAALFAALDRLRGWVGILVLIPAAVLGGIVWCVTDAWLPAVLAGLAYWAGESFGQTAYLWGLMRRHTQAEFEDKFKDDDTGQSSGLDWVLAHIAPLERNYYVYAWVGMALRGVWWWGLIYSVFWWFGIVGTEPALVAVAILGVGMSICYRVAYGLPEILGQGYLGRAHWLYGALYGTVIYFSLFGV